MKVLDTPDLAGLEAAEGRLQAAVAGNNADGLALSLHDDLLATAPDGAFATKAEDVAGYLRRVPCDVLPAAPSQVTAARGDRGHRGARAHPGKRRR